MKKIVAFALTLLASASLYAADCDQGQNAPLRTFAKETLTVSTTAVILTSSVYSPNVGIGGGEGATMALITTENDTMRFFDDGSTPTSSVGHLVASGSSLIICGASNVKQLKMIRSGTNDVTATISYFRGPN